MPLVLCAEFQVLTTVNFAGLLSDSITYCVTSIGILRAGHILFPISVRNGSAAVAELLRRTGCGHVLVSEDEHMSAVAESAIGELEGVSLHPIQTFEALFPEETPESDDNNYDVHVEYNVDDVAMILHSSGESCYTHKDPHVR